VTLVAVCIVHKETRSASFLVWPQNQGRLFISGLTSKTLGWISRFKPQNWQLWFDDFKITMMISWFGYQNHAGYDLSITPQNRQEDEDGAGHASRSSGLL
jgi:hypothetical protein